MSMKIKVVIHEVEEGEFWAEVPAIAGCAKGKPWNGFCRIYYEAIEGCLSVDVKMLSL